MRSSTLWVLKDIADKLTWTHFGRKRRSHEEEGEVIPMIGYFGHTDSIPNKKEES
jgi:hypothetical protein